MVTTNRITYYLGEYSRLCVRSMHAVQELPLSGARVRHGKVLRGTSSSQGQGQDNIYSTTTTTTTFTRAAAEQRFVREECRKVDRIGHDG